MTKTELKMNVYKNTKIEKLLEITKAQQNY